MDDRSAISEMVVRIARALVDSPDQVGVADREDRDRVVFELTVAENERGQVIGRGGRVAHALRAVTQAAGRARGVRATLDIID